MKQEKAEGERQKAEGRNRNQPSNRAGKTLVAYCLILTVFVFGALAQNPEPEVSGSHSSRPFRVGAFPGREKIEFAIGARCSEREGDPSGSMPIDEMQGRPSLPPAHPDAVAGMQRAERLLPVARKLVMVQLRQLAAEYKLNNKLRLDAATGRVDAVKSIRPDMDARDNASVRFREPHTINFGTIFLAGLRSDESMISVLSHELTHIADGRKRSLQPLYRLIGRRAAERTGLHISEQRSEELTCDLVGLMSARSYIERNPSYEPLPRRASRAIEHNCVEEDITDEDHLSPRNTMRALFVLDPALAHDIVGDREPPERDRITGELPGGRERIYQDIALRSLVATPQSSAP
jgi:hypothetical protein